MTKCLSELVAAGFNVRAIVTDNHSANVMAFNKLLKSYGGVDDIYLGNFPNSKIYLFFNTVHLLKNIRSNLLNTKKFVFPEFYFSNGDIKISVEAGYICWYDIHRIYDCDQNLSAN